MRLDRYLRISFPGLTQSIIQRSVRKGLIKINHLKCSAKFQITGGEVLSIPNSFQTTSYRKNQKSIPIGAASLAKKLFGALAVHEDEEILVISKPAKLATQGGSKISISVDDAIRFQNNTYGTEMRIVHRLDKDTSGLLMIAKNRPTAVKIANAFKNSLIEKRYLALFYGKPKAKEGWIKSEIDETEAVSYYRVVTKFSDQLWCVLYVPKTGKMHQIRKHALLMGGAIVGDQKYNDMYNSPYSQNLMLHASYIRLPKTIESLQKNKFHAPLPLYWRQFLNQHSKRHAISTLEQKNSTLK